MRAALPCRFNISSCSSTYFWASFTAVSFSPLFLPLRIAPPPRWFDQYLVYDVVSEAFLVFLAHRPVVLLVLAKVSIRIQYRQESFGNIIGARLVATSNVVPR